MTADGGIGHDQTQYLLYSPRSKLGISNVAKFTSLPSRIGALTAVGTTSTSGRSSDVNPRRPRGQSVNAVAGAHRDETPIDCSSLSIAVVNVNTVGRWGSILDVEGKDGGGIICGVIDAESRCDCTISPICRLHVNIACCRLRTASDCGSTSEMSPELLVVAATSRSTRGRLLSARRSRSRSRMSASSWTGTYVTSAAETVGWRRCRALVAIPFRSAAMPHHVVGVTVSARSRRRRLSSLPRRIARQRPMFRGRQRLIRCCSCLGTSVAVEASSFWMVASAPDLPR